MNIFSRKIDKLEGSCQCPGDKSISQRIVMIGSLMQTDIKVDNFLMGADPISTMNSMIAIGASIEVNGNNVFIKNKNKNFKSPKLSLDLGNSGTGMRLMMGLISGLNLKAQLSGDDSLSKRPMLRVSDPLSELGALVSTSNGTAPIDINGNKGIVDNWTYEMPIASAQVKSALLLAALTANKNMTIVEGKYTRDHTERMINFFGGSVNSLKKEAKNYITLSNKRMDIEHEQYTVAGDFSSSAFIIVAALISNKADILIKNVGINETRSGLITVLKEMNGDIQVLNKRNQCNEKVADIRVRSSKLIGIEVPSWIIPNIIDEIPILSIAASFADGKTFIRDAKELRVKESDRLQATSDGLSKIGVQHKQHDDGIEIYGNSSFYIDKENIIINSYDDHRIAMSFLIAGMKSHKGIKVKNCQNIKTSFPNFIELMNNLGGNFVKSESKVITIDGPSASGKGALTKALAQFLNYKILDSGLLYRAYAYFYEMCLGSDEIKENIKNLDIEIANNELMVIFDGSNLTNDLRSEKTAKLASELSALKDTRSNLLGIQRALNNELGLIADGRDMGTVVFPNAGNKFFLTASAEIRAKRRFLELQNRGQEVNMRDLIDDIEKRDLADQSRELSPLLPANDATVIDTSDMSLEEVFNFTKKLIKGN